MRDTPLILIADDEDIIRNILERLIHGMAYNSLTSGNGTEALSLIRQYKPDLVLLDIMMPGVECCEILSALRSDKAIKDTVVILISGNDDMDMVAECIEAGADDFLPKPFNHAMLKIRIDNALQSSQYRQELKQVKNSREEFCRKLSHDINNALTGIVMSAEMMLMEAQSESATKALHDIIESTERITEMIKKRRRAPGNKSE